MPHPYEPAQTDRDGDPTGLDAAAASAHTRLPATENGEAASARASLDVPAHKTKAGRVAGRARLTHRMRRMARRSHHEESRTQSEAHDADGGGDRRDIC